MKYRELKAKLADLEAEISAVQAEGNILVNARVDSSKPGGTTARGQPAIQYRLRVKGQKARYLKAFEVAKTRAAIARGKRLKQLERERKRVQAKLNLLTIKAAKLGIELPE